MKAYAVDFCGTKTLRDATREQVENFVQQLADWAEKDRNALLCQLNSYAQPETGGRCRMKRHFQVLHDTTRDSRRRFPTAYSWFASTAPSIAGIAQKPFYILRSRILEPRELAGQLISGASTARQGPVEAGLVPARFRLRPGTSRPG